MDGQTYTLRSHPLNKFYAWGRGELGFDVRTPRLATVPRSLAMLLGFLRSGSFLESCSHKDGALELLEVLSCDTACQKALGKLPQCVETLVCFVCDGEVSIQRKLGAFLQDVAKAEAIANGAAQLLGSLTKDNEVGETVGRMPWMLGDFLNALGVTSISTDVARVLYNSTRGPEAREAIANSGVLLKKLVS
ncbi:hypothetical protein KFL_011320010 [Klebsormidium nitens]|uniref:Uncharacterized protein n=1 Tax=Klebsormidium nitens TaxID=105231 RepID=A0A1Y1IQ02_KLENI|nr:hypothetical protein KFL_011320010 [Klebsormidium nitens]|eukprot:GAQ92774.1 hypothetical protein KFL_011320010 [Klebsormidium nitens]